MLDTFKVLTKVHLVKKISSQDKTKLVSFLLFQVFF